MTPEARHRLPDGTGLGVALAVLSNLVLFFVCLGLFPSAVLAFGLVQWIGLLPIYLVARKQGSRRTANGVLITGSILLLLQAAFYGLIWVMFRGSGFRIG